MISESFLSPIHDYTNVPFRLLCQRHGAGATAVPLVSSAAIVRKARTIDATEDEKHVYVQLVGTKADEISEAVRIIEHGFPFVKGFDVNCGCPSYGTVSNGGGSALMKKPESIVDIVKEMKKSTGLSVSVKIRIFQDKGKTIELARKIEDAGVDFIAVHGRTAKQGYSGVSDWERIREIKESLSIPVVGNGDLKSAEQGRAKVKQGSCDSFMIARAAMANPMVFRDKTVLSKEERKRLFSDYIKLCEEFDALTLRDLKLKSAQLFRYIEEGAALRHALMQSKTVEELIGKVL